MLGKLYFKGKGAPKDIVRAHKWMNIAAYTHGTYQYENDDKYEEAVELRDKIEIQMSPAQIAEAQKLAREFVRKNYKGC